MNFTHSLTLVRALSSFLNFNSLAKYKHYKRVHLFDEGNECANNLIFLMCTRLINVN